MKSRKITLSVLLLGIMAIIAVLSGCKENKKNEVQKSLAEKIVGKWNVTGSYEKLNGEWVSIIGEGDECRYDFRPDGIVSAYQRNKGQELSAEIKWSMDEETGKCTFTQENGKVLPLKVVFDNDDQFSIYYTSIFDPSTGQHREGEFKDVQQREN